DLKASRGAPTMLEPEGEAGGRQSRLAYLRPLDEHHRVVEVRLEVSPLGGGETAESVEVEVRNVGGAAVVAMTDRERRARDGVLDAQRPAGAADECRLARSELARDGHHVSRGQAVRERRRNCLSLGWKI